MRFLRFDTLESTNLEAARLAANGERGPLWISADRQTGGKGRRGRDWISQDGNLFCTGLFAHKGSAAEAARYSFVAAIAVAETFARYIDPDLIGIKWPNDVLIKGQKACGILLESGGGADDMWIAVGIGLNLRSAPDLPGYPVTRLLAHIDPAHLTGPEPLYTGPQAVLAILSERFGYWRDMYMRAGFAPIRQAWLARAANIGGPVTVRLEGREFTGIAESLNESGGLCVRKSGGMLEIIHAGDVFPL